MLGGWLVVILPSSRLWPSDSEGAQRYYRGGYRVSIHYGESRDRQGLSDVTIGKQGGYKGQTWEVMG